MTVELRTPARLLVWVLCLLGLLELLELNRLLAQETVQTPVVQYSGNYRDKEALYTAEIYESFPSREGVYTYTVAVSTDTAFQLQRSGSDISATFTTLHQEKACPLGPFKRFFALQFQHLFQLATGRTLPEPAGPEPAGSEVLFVVPAGYRPLSPVTLRVKTHPIQADGTPGPDVPPLHVDVRLDAQGSVNYLDPYQVLAATKTWGKVSKRWGFSATVTWLTAESYLVGRYDNVAEHYDARYELRRQGSTVAAHFVSTRSPVPPSGLPAEVLFTVPLGYRPATTVTRLVTGNPVQVDGNPQPTQTESLQFRVQVRPDGTVRHAFVAAGEQERYWTYSFHTAWGTTLTAGDRLALAALEVPFVATEPEGYVWGSMKRPLASWEGITANAKGRVTHLELNRNNVTWHIPPSELGDLTGLEELKAPYPSGPFFIPPCNCTIPPELGSLSSLITLDLTGFDFEGSIPPELGKLANLEFLILESELLEGRIPPELGQLSRLKHLELIVEGIDGPIPPELGQLSHLEYLDLSNANLTGTFPPELGQLSNLKYLFLAGGQLRGPLPAELGKLAALEELFLGSWSDLGPLPPEIGQLQSLQHLSVINSGLRGPIPPELGFLTNLETLDLTDNVVDGWLPAELGQLTSLEVLYLSNNNLEGPIPPELGQLANVVVVDFSNNNLEGPIPPELGQLRSLDWIDLAHNQLWGPIPPSLGQIRSLTWIDLAHNQLWGPIPMQLGMLDHLAYLDLGNNQFSGSVPPILGNLSSIRYMNLKGNQLSGCLPQSLHPIHIRGIFESDLPLCEE